MRVMLEYQTMPRAVHGLQSESFTALHPMAMLMRLQQEHVFLVVAIVAASLPQIRVEQVRCYDFLVPSPYVLMAHQFNQTIVDLSPMTQEERTAWRIFAEEK